MTDFMFALPEPGNTDFTEHNEEVRELWAAFKAGVHKRVPVILAVNPRMLLLDPAYNTRGVTYESYFNDPEVMAQALLEWQYWTRFLLPDDTEKGLPEQWEINVDFANVYDAAYFDAPVHYREWQVPCAMPWLYDDNKRAILDKGIPEPLAHPWVRRALEYRDCFSRKSASGWTFLGRPVVAGRHTPFLSTDGVFTAAACLRGATGLCEDLLADPEYLQELLELLLSGIVGRIQALRSHFEQPAIPEDGWGTADDSIELLSVEQYRESVLPFHKRLYDALAPATGRGIHLCGDAQRLFRVIYDELGVDYFDTGFPLDFKRFREEMGPDVTIQGGPPVSFFLEDKVEPIIKETRRILASGILDGGKFVLREANNLAPMARLDCCRAFYETGRRYGVLD